VPTTEKEPLPWYRDEFRASQRASEDRRDVAFRLRRRRLRGRTGVAVLFASLTVMVGAAAAAPSATTRGASTQSTTQAVQQALGIPADGIYGPQTRTAVRAYQRAHGLLVDGIAGPQTLAALGVAGGGQEARAAAARTATATAASAAAGGESALLERIAQCESGGDPTAVSSGGLYRGKYQFSRETWRAVGGSGDPAAASEAEQDKRAAMLLQVQGAAAWPVCSGS
jgi:hypothetical protein